MDELRRKRSDRSEGEDMTIKQIISIVLCVISFGCGIGSLILAIKSQKLSRKARELSKKAQELADEAEKLRQDSIEYNIDNANNDSSD